MSMSTLSAFRSSAARRFVGARAFSAAAFPSMSISASGVTAQGSFAEMQRDFLTPDPKAVSSLSESLRSKQMGVVAHFYMDAELQGTLQQASSTYPHIFCADSLAMGEAAVKMAQEGVKQIACLGVDFMSESVRATLDQNGFPDVPVFRLDERHIGCSLAESAERMAYDLYLKQAAKATNPLHVVYINTSMRTKAAAHRTVPTITCTSSNVLRTVLQAAVDIPDVTIWYGPDSYMGENLYTMLTMLSTLSDEEVARVHEAHTAASIKSLLSRFNYFKQGICVVHHMFGDKVTRQVQEQYPLSDDTFHTAHFEVPGEMFALAMAAQQQGKGVVGSTSNILNFIVDKSKEAAAKGTPRVRFVLGTESGMVTSVVRGVKAALPANSTTQVEIVFPVSSEAVSQTGEADTPVVPGVAGGEGCSTAGGCATCPYMKMNSLDSLVDVVAKVQEPGNITKELAPYLAATRGLDAEAMRQGGRPIMEMRHLMSKGRLSPELVAYVTKGTRTD